MAGNQVDNIQILDASAPYLVRSLESTDNLQISAKMEVQNDVLVTGDLTVQGTTITIETETVLAEDNHLFLNYGYTTPVGETGGLVINYLPTATVDTVNGAFTAGVAGVSNPTVVTTAAATFAVGDLIMVSGAADTDNNGLYEVLSHVGTTLTIRGIGTVGTVEDFTDNQFTTDSTAQGAITKVNVSILRAGTDGEWEYGKGSATGIVFTDISAGATIDLQGAYDNTVGSPATITTNATHGAVVIAGDQKLQVTATNGLDVDTIADFDVTAFDVQMTGTNGFSIDGTAASNVSVTSGNLTLSTITTGDVLISSAGEADITSVGLVDINAGANMDVDVTGNYTMDSTGTFSIDGAGASNVTTDTGNLTLSTTTSGDVAVTSANDVLVTAANEIDLTSTGLIDVNAGANLDIDVTGTYDMLATSTFSIDGTGASNVSATSGNLTLSTITTGDVLISSAGEADITSVGLVDINAGANMDVDVTGNYTMDSTGTFSIDGTGASNVSATSGNLTISTLTTGSLILTSAQDMDVNIPAASTTAFNIGDGASTYINIDSTAAAPQIDLDEHVNLVEGAGIEVTTGIALVQGELVSFTSAGQLQKADADTATLIDALCIGVSRGNAGIGTSAQIFTVSGSLVPVLFGAAPGAADNGKPVYVSSTAGQGSLTAPAPPLVGKTTFLVGYLQGGNGVTTTPDVLWCPQFISRGPGVS